MEAAYPAPQALLSPQWSPPPSLMPDPEAGLAPQQQTHPALILRAPCTGSLWLLLRLGSLGNLQQCPAWGSSTRGELPSC